MVTPARGPWTGPRYEYRTLVKTETANPRKTLRNWGRAGWDLVGVEATFNEVDTSPCTRLYFKRQILD
jgi:hypothetical protein